MGVKWQGGTKAKSCLQGRPELLQLVVDTCDGEHISRSSKVG